VGSGVWGGGCELDEALYGFLVGLGSSQHSHQLWLMGI
jgi:hypothetical protein